MGKTKKIILPIVVEEDFIVKITLNPKCIVIDKLYYMSECINLSVKQQSGLLAVLDEANLIRCLGILNLNT